MKLSIFTLVLCVYGAILPQKPLTGTSKITKKPDSFWDYHVKNEKFAGYQLRVKKSDPATLGIDTVDQYSGYFDIEGQDKHFFYYFFESRNDPKKDPLIIWLNGCSSLTGLFFELGPSSIDKNLKPVYNPYSWNNNASVIFLDQPIGTGFSYPAEKAVYGTDEASKDFYVFMELFFQKFPQFLGLPFHMAGESYGGHYVPDFATEILNHHDRSFDVTSVLIGNGITDPLRQTPEYYNMACTDQGGYKPVLDEAICQRMEETLPLCTALIRSCYALESPLTCAPASAYCERTQLGPYQQTGKNIYDVRKMCEGHSGCYMELEYVEDYLNQKYVQQALGTEIMHFVGCSPVIGQHYALSGDMYKPFHRNVARLLENGIPVLLYSGDKDYICNWLGNQRWSNELEWSGQVDFVEAEMKPIYTDGTQVGQVKNSGTFTFARIYDAGHLVPFDKPAESLDMAMKWIAGDYALKGMSK